MPKDRRTGGDPRRRVVISDDAAVDAALWQLADVLGEIAANAEGTGSDYLEETPAEDNGRPEPPKGQ